MIACVRAIIILLLEDIVRDLTILVLIIIIFSHFLFKKMYIFKQGIPLV